VEFTDELVSASGEEEFAVGGVGEFCFACDVGIGWDDPGRSCCRGHRFLCGDDSFGGTRDPWMRVSDATRWL